MVRMPTIEPVDHKTEKACSACGSFFERDTVEREAVTGMEFLWWNCPCGNTLVLKSLEV